MPFHRKVITVMPVVLLGFFFVFFVYLSSSLSRPTPSLLYDKMDYTLLETISNRLNVLRLNSAHIPAYEGGKDDDIYLKNYIVALASSLYGVPQEMFDRPTLASTSLLRDMVHKFNYQLSGVRREKKVDGATDRNDSAAMWRYGVRGICGLMSHTLFEIYKAMDYKTNRVDLINGSWGKRRQEGRYSKSHVTTEVYLDDYQKFVVQDPTYNLMMVDNDGDVLSLLEARQRHFETAKPYKFRHFTIGIERSTYPEGVTEHIDEIVQNEWPFFIVKRKTFRGRKTRVLDIRRLNEKMPDRNRLNIEDVRRVIRQTCHGKSLQRCIKHLGRVYDASGYIFFDTETQLNVAEYIQIGVSDGYVSVDYKTKKIHRGQHAEILQAHVLREMENKEDLMPLDTMLSPVSYVDYKGRLLKWVF